MPSVFWCTRGCLIRLPNKLATIPNERYLYAAGDKEVEYYSQISSGKVQHNVPSRQYFVRVVGTGQASQAMA